jgi:chemotaxis protein methyltransferase CheR
MDSAHAPDGGSLEDLEIDLLLEGVYQHYGHDFRGFERASLRKKLHGLMRTLGVKTISALQESVLHEAQAWQALLNCLSVKPVALFDEPEHMLALRRLLAPWLRTCPSPKIWIADCQSAEEACSLAILLAEEKLHGRTQIFATVSNDAALEEAKGGSFELGRVPEYESNYRRGGGTASLSDYFVEKQGRAVFLPGLRANITWAQYSLATDASFNEFELIVCRRRLGDFGPILRRRTLQLFHDSLSRFGILSLDQSGTLETMPFDVHYQAVYAAQGLFKRVR